VTTNHPIYRGRFAPTPSGPLHLGSLLTAVASYLQARRALGTWNLRLDDLDQQRCSKVHAVTIMRQLEQHGLEWDGDVYWQTQHIEMYEAGFSTLQRRTEGYACVCSRARLNTESLEGVDGPIYRGSCRKSTATHYDGAWRIRIQPGQLTLNDPWQGLIRRDLSDDVGDFIVRRADGQIAYQLACVLDEAALGITEVVRGADLIGSTMRQLYLWRHLSDQKAPEYRHIPVLLGADGNKLSKQNHAKSIDQTSPSFNLHQCLELLGQTPPRMLLDATPDELLDWAVANWQPLAIPRLTQLAQAA